MSIAELQANTVDNTENTQLFHKITEEDEEYQMIILNEFPRHHYQIPEPCTKYWNVRQNVTLDDNLIVNGCWLLIPAQIWKKKCYQNCTNHI